MARDSVAGAPVPEEPGLVSEGLVSAGLGREKYQKPELLRLGSLAASTGSSAGSDTDGQGPAPELS